MGKFLRRLRDENKECIVLFQWIFLSVLHACVTFVFRELVSCGLWFMWQCHVMSKFGYGLLSTKGVNELN
ncbi:hypothetical protein QVD17_15076 [Tagetes erecta]|uniref:Uncharacterized protein n=1 Tax=Tagetes erecta TaxID=13708 RepID=A0AAD8NSA8_TARER|nr:hypothetical protein QVD17_15076 [Tagetes erecta]